MNLREIANRAKVSIATVSRTINRVPTVRPAYARRVQKVIDEVGYYPNTTCAGTGFRPQPHFRPDGLGDYESLFP